MPTDPTPVPPRFLLRSLSISARLGITAFLFILAAGFVASAAHLQFHHQNRDERPGVSLNDIKGAYHGVEILSPLLTSLESGHPDTLSKNDRTTLLDWLNSGRISENYDNLDLGDNAPAEIIARECVSCHSERAASTHPAAAQTPLDNYERIRALAFTRKLDPPPVRILVMSTHAHALSMGAMSLVLGALLLTTRLRRPITDVIFMLTGLALAADIAGWWLARPEYWDGLSIFRMQIPDLSMSFVYVIIGAGLIYNAMSGLSLAIVFFDLWLPRRRRA